MRILFALLSVGFGVLLLFEGYRLARIVIPLIGFLMGMSLGGAVFSDLANTPFLATLAGITVGVLTGIFFAALAYAYYYLAVVLLGGGLGYWLGSGLILWLGFSPGALSAIIGIALGILVAMFAIMSNAPKFVLMVLTSITGAVATAGGVLLLFNVIPLDFYSYSTASFAIRNSFFWSVVAIALAAIGMAAQAKMAANSDYDFHEWGGEGHHPQVPPTATHMPAS
jgi:hypothetical protein